VTAVSESVAPSTGTRGRAVIEIAVVAIVAGLYAAGAARPLIALSALGFALLALEEPRIAAAALAAFILLVPSSQYGLAPGAAENPYDLYYMGSNQLHISIIELALGVLLLAVVLRRATGSLVVAPTWFPVWPALAFTAVYACQLMLALARGIGPLAATNYYSGRLMFDTLLVAALVTWLVRDQDREQVMRLFVALVASRAIYGLVRFAFFGGDPQNFYLNYQHTTGAISFWDLADAAFFSLVALFSVGRLIRGKGTNPLAALGWLALALLTSAGVALTHRRSTVFGFGLAMLAFFILEGLWRRPGWLLIPAAAAVIGVRGLFQRFATSSLFGVLTADSMSPSGDLTGNRFLESASAWVTVIRHPVLGRGLTGAYDPLPGFSPFTLTTIVHNGVLFVWLKLGVFGVFALAWLLYATLRVTWRTRRALYVNDPQTLFLDAWLASSFLWFVDAVFGTPLIERRHVLAIGIWLGMLLVACRPLRQERAHAAK
jgi:hypothetical protein